MTGDADTNASADYDVDAAADADDDPDAGAAAAATEVEMNIWTVFAIGTNKPRTNLPLLGRSDRGLTTTPLSN